MDTMEVISVTTHLDDYKVIPRLLPHSHLFFSSPCCFLFRKKLFDSSLHESFSYAMSTTTSTPSTTTVLAKPPVLNIFDLKNYSFNSDTKEPQYEKDKTVQARLQRFKEVFDKTGMRRSVFGVLLVNHNLYPAVLLLKIGNNNKGFYKLPGGRCRANESEIDCLKRKLSRRLAPDEVTANWNIKECISVWYRPAFETYLVLFTIFAPFSFF